MAQHSQNSEKKIFSDLLEQYYSRLKGFAQSFLKDEGLAEEVVMDVFLKLWERRTNTDVIEDMTTYLFVAVRNTCHNYLRKENNRWFDSLDQVQVELSSYDKTPEEEMISQEMLTELNKAVDALPPKCKMIFKLLREEGLSRKDTAKVLNVSVNTIDNQVAIAVRKIGDALGLDLTVKRNVTGLRSFLLCF